MPPSERTRPEAADEVVFRSTAHPGDAVPAFVASRYFLETLSALLLPLALVVASAALLGQSILPLLIYGLPVALVGAAAGTFYHIRSILAEVRVRPSGAVVRTVFQCLFGVHPAAGPVLDVRRDHTAIFAAIGDASYRFLRSEWAASDDLLAALVEARNAWRADAEAP